MMYFLSPSFELQFDILNVVKEIRQMKREKVDTNCSEIRLKFI